MTTEVDTPNMTPRQYAQKHGIRLDTVYQKLWAGKLSGIKHDGKWLIKSDTSPEDQEPTARNL
jgi:hypothetical protein